MEKICSKHGLTKFSTGARPRCNKCMVEAVQKRRVKIKEMSIEYKGGRCQICGYDKCKDALEFHHMDSFSKEFAISDSGHSRSWQRVKQELDKCICVCANCHREIHSTKGDIA